MVPRAGIEPTTHCLEGKIKILNINMLDVYLSFFILYFQIFLISFYLILC